MKVKRKRPFYYVKETTCTYCDGDGYTEHLSCSAPISECCGGCYKKRICDECDGDGYSKTEKTIDELIYNYKKNKRK